MNDHQPVSNLDTPIRAVRGFERVGRSDSRYEIEEVPGYRFPAGPVIRGARRVDFGDSTTVHARGIVGNDDRTVVPATTILPWRFICALQITTKRGTIYPGTGWFAGPRTIVTAGHCVYWHNEGGWAQSIQVTPGRNGADRPYGTYNSSELVSVNGWVQDRHIGSDYGAILLAESPGTQIGWFGYSVLNDSDLVDGTGNISGYPSDKENATRQYFHARKIISVRSETLVYDIDTFSGQSGSPVWFNSGGQRAVVGIHTYEDGRNNMGTRITNEVAQNLALWTRGVA
jgi:V8-like Glu-specific endopeptidase